MLKPVNGHLLIDPVKQEGFMATQQDTYQEVGIVVDLDENYLGLHKVSGNISYFTTVVSKGDKVYFDSWLAAKYPKADGEFYWLVKFEDVRAIEHPDATA